jgi:uncharacterized membrane protein
MHGYILVVDTQGINVWCAAGKGTFGTDELVQRIETTGLRDVVRHQRLILPQLSAPGVAAHEVKERSGFKVEYGPVRAADLPAYLNRHQATPAMRQVRFSLAERLVLIPVELVHVALAMVVAGTVAYLVGGTLVSAAVVAAMLAGVVLFPILLPWIPTHDFSSKGFVLGLVVGLPFALMGFLRQPGEVWWLQLGGALALLLALSPVTAFLALNFTGSTTFTSRSGVRREISGYVPVMAWTFGTGVVLALTLFLVRR